MASRCYISFWVPQVSNFGQKVTKNTLKVAFLLSICPTFLTFNVGFILQIVVMQEGKVKITTINCHFLSLSQWWSFLLREKSGRQTIGKLCPPEQLYVTGWFVTLADHTGSYNKNNGCNSNKRTLIFHFLWLLFSGFFSPSSSTPHLLVR